MFEFEGLSHDIINGFKYSWLSAYELKVLQEDSKDEADPEEIRAWVKRLVPKYETPAQHLKKTLKNMDNIEEFKHKN